MCGVPVPLPRNLTQAPDRRRGCVAICEQMVEDPALLAKGLVGVISHVVTPGTVNRRHAPHRGQKSTIW